MTRSLDADVTIAYVRELAKMWRRETFANPMHGEFAGAMLDRARAKAIVLEDLAQQLEQHAVTLKEPV